MLGIEFKAWRTKLGFSQEEVAHRFRISRVTVINWENGNSPISQIVEQLCSSYDEHWKQQQRRRPDFGPVRLIYGGGYAGEPILPVDGKDFPDNEAALAWAASRWDQLCVGHPLVLDETRRTVWDFPDLETEIERRRAASEKQIGTPGLADRLMELGRHFSSLPVYDDRSPDEIIGYDENGLPR